MLKKLMHLMRMLRECFLMSLNNIRGSRMRSFLTVLGVVIGVMAVVVLVAIGQGANSSVVENRWHSQSIFLSLSLSPVMSFPIPMNLLITPD